MIKRKTLISSKSGLTCRTVPVNDFKCKIMFIEFEPNGKEVTA